MLDTISMENHEKLVKIVKLVYKIIVSNNCMFLVSDGPRKLI